ncbi:MAG: energy-coupling factor transporter ATPase [Lachnospiraceae bacterium]|nr:energy-coupling factor transporter ATPase [Lachnospiraceae bacterium]
MVLELKNIQYKYNVGMSSEIEAIKDVNLVIKSGEFVGIIGHTGSGKSTLIQHFNGLLKPTGGEVLCDGEDIFDKKYDIRRHRCNVGMVFQYPEHQLFESSIIEDVCFGPLNKGLSKDDAYKAAKKALSLVGITEDLYEKSPFELSGGQKRRVAIAGVLAMDPEMLILDEPTAGLDPVGRDAIYKLLTELCAEKGIAVVVVSHSMEDMAKYAKRLIVMYRGTVLFDDVPNEVFKHRDELEKCGLTVPKISYIMDKIMQAGVPVRTDIINMEDAKEELIRVLTGFKNYGK